MNGCVTHVFTLPEIVTKLEQQLVLFLHAHIFSRSFVVDELSTHSADKPWVQPIGIAHIFHIVEVFLGLFLFLLHTGQSHADLIHSISKSSNSDELRDQDHQDLVSVDGRHIPVSHSQQGRTREIERVNILCVPCLVRDAHLGDPVIVGMQESDGIEGKGLC